MSEREESSAPVPRARLEKNWRRYLFWLIPVAAVAITVWLVYEEVIKKGPTIHVFFENAAGLQAGNSKLKYRGVEVGTVTAIEITDNNKMVKVTVDTLRSGDTLAREGSLFWIVKPEIGLNKITGLQTVMGGSYLTVQPGTGKRQTEFRGLAEPSPTRKQEPGLRVVLLAEKLGSIKQYSPVMYHGVQVGEVSDSGLGPSAQAVRIFLDIEKKYAPLVRMNSRFWNAGGLNIKIGLGGIDINAQSASTIITGGINFVTPDTREEAAYDGAAFRLYDKPEPAWLSWFPEISLPLVVGPNPNFTAPRRSEK